MAILRWSRKSTLPNASESQLQQLFDSLNDVVMMLDEQRILFINPCWEKMTGLMVDQTVNQSFSDFLHPEDIPNWSRLLDRLDSKGSDTSWFRLISASGEICWVEMRIQICSSSPTVYTASLCDITPQVRQEQVRDAGHRSLQSLVNRLPVMLYRARNNVNWTMEYVSDGCELITGYSAESMLNQSQISLGQMIHPEDAPDVWGEVQSALQTQDYFDLSYRLTHKDGQEVMVQDKGRGLYSESGMVLGVEGIILQKI